MLRRSRLRRPTSAVAAVFVVAAAAATLATTIPNASAQDADRPALRPPDNFRFNPADVMGGYLTLSQTEDELDRMRELYPSLISEKMSIGRSVEGRDIWMVRVSDNPDVDEPADAEPEVLYTSLTHAREPQTLATMLYFLWDLLESYGSGGRVADIVDHHELYVVPVVNPDGYVFNEAVAPEGGGRWRKNRRPNGDGTFGVDLNRNFSFQWGFDDIGSSPRTNSNIYRGPSPFSEPETAALRDLVAARDFRTSFQYHSAAGLLLHPWTYDPADVVGHPAYPGLSELLTAANGVPITNGVELLGPANGIASDWLHSEGVFTWTPEVGPSAPFGQFWPGRDRIVELADEWVEANLVLAEMAGGLGTVAATASTAALVPGGTLELSVEVERQGIDPGRYRVEVTSAAPVTATCDDAPLADIELLATVTVTCTVTTPSGASGTGQVLLDVELHDSRRRVAATSVPLVWSPPAGSNGYLLVESNGAVLAFGSGIGVLGTIDPTATLRARDSETMAFAAAALQFRLGGEEVVDAELRPGGDGLWALTSAGRIVGVGDAPDLAPVPTSGDARPVALVVPADADGVWVFMSDGAVVGRGAAVPSDVEAAAVVVTGRSLVRPIVDAVASIDGTGAYAVAADGGVFAYGAPLVGSVPGALGGRLPDHPVVGMVADPDGRGYWMVAADGGVFAFDAPFVGSLPAIVPFDQLDGPVTGMVPLGDGYLLVASDGGIFDFAGGRFAGSGAGLLASPAVDVIPLG